MKTEPNHQFEQVDSLSLMDGLSDKPSSRWVEEADGFLWGVVVVVVVVLAVVGVVL